MLFVLLQFLTGHSKGNREDADAGIQVGRVGFNIVDTDAQGPDGGDEIRQIAFVFQFQMDFKVVGAVLQVLFQYRKTGHAGQHGEKQPHCHRIDPRAKSHADDGATPEAY